MVRGPQFEKRRPREWKIRGYEPRWEERSFVFSATIQFGPGAHAAFSVIGTGAITGHVVELTTHPHLAPMLHNEHVCTSQYALCAFMACYVKNFTLNREVTSQKLPFSARNAKARFRFHIHDTTSICLCMSAIKIYT